MQKRGIILSFLSKEKIEITGLWINHNYRTIYTFKKNNTKGKVFQTHNNKHANFIGKIVQEKQNIFPEILEIKDNFVYIEWVEGKNVSDYDLIELINLLVSIQSIEYYDDEPFDYIENLVLPRFMRAKPIVGFDLCYQIEYIIMKESNDFIKKVSHPDITPSNVIKTNNGVVCIDIELLCYTRHYIIDIFNLLKNIDGNRNNLFKLYLNKVNLSIDLIKLKYNYIQSLWFAREVGSILIKRRDIEAILLLKDLYLRGKNILPIDLE